MRKQISRVLLAAAILLAASGCARVDLTNQWPALAEPTGWEPKGGVCTSSYAETSYRDAYQPFDCAGSHMYETVHIGQFTGDAAALGRPPDRSSTAVKAAWSECDAKTTEFLGAEWRTGWIWISVSLPSMPTWESGARWFRCEVATTEVRSTKVVARKTSLKGEFAGESMLKLGCYDLAPNDSVTAKACTEAHNTEFAGVYASNDPWEMVSENQDSVHQRCRSVIAAYAGVPDDGNMRYRTGTWYYVPDKDDWEAGDHSVRCHLYLGKQVTRSLRGAGTKGLPINYR